MTKIKTLLIEDSGLMRIMISDALRADPEIEVIGTANNGHEGVEKVRDMRPDVVITDMLMPKYDGLYAVKNIMSKTPIPIILLSSLDRANSEVFDALNAGAFDFIDKPQTKDAVEFKSALRSLKEKIKIASGMDASVLGQKGSKSNHHEHTFDGILSYQILVIGASTGGPSAIEAVVSKLPENLAIPVVVIQHMPERFLISYAERLRSLLPLPVELASRNSSPKAGTIYIVPGDGNMALINNNKNVPTFQYVRKKFKDYDSPSINCMFESVAQVYGTKAIGLILTGMGRDGTIGLSAIKQMGGLTIAQDAASCVVNGMPQAAADYGAVDYRVKINEIPGFIMSCF